MGSTNKYYAVYTISTRLTTGDTSFTLPFSDLISVSFLNNFDYDAFPIMRLNIYTDLINYNKLVENPDEIKVSMSFDASMSKVVQNENNTSDKQTIVNGAESFTIGLNAYIETKNAVSSLYDQYNKGIKKSNDLNEQIKVPIQLYCYNANAVRALKDKPNSIYKDMSVLSVVQYIMDETNVQYRINNNVGSSNTSRYDQILIPNLNTIDTLAFLEKNYGLTEKGASLFYNIYDEQFELYDLDTSNSNINNSYVIRVEEASDTDSSCGYIKYNNGFDMSTSAENVCVITESDIDRLFFTEELYGINLDSLNVTSAKMEKLYANEANKKEVLKSIELPSILHFSDNEYIMNAAIARVEERITTIDVSGEGWRLFRPGATFRLIFSSPMRGANIEDIYRPVYINQVLNAIGDGTFVASTAMRLCTN